MATEKNHSMRHGAGDIIRYGNSINMSCEAVQLSMMLHTLRKLEEASAILCDAVQGDFSFTSYIMHILHILPIEHILHIMQIQHILHISHCVIIVNLLLSQD